MKLEVILAKLAANESTPSLAPPPKPLGVKPIPPKLTGPKIGPRIGAAPALKPPAPGGAPQPVQPLVPAAPPGGGPQTNTGAAAATPTTTPAPAPAASGADAGDFGGMMGQLAGNFKGIAAGATPEHMGQFMNAMGPITKGVAGMGGLPAIAGMMSTARGDGNFSSLVRGAGG